MLLAFFMGMGILLYKLQSEAAYYISNSSNVDLGYVYDRDGEILFDQDASTATYGSDYFLDIGNLIGDDSGQMTNTLVAQNQDLLVNFSFMLGVQGDGESAIYTTIDHSVNQAVYQAFGSKNGCAVAYNYLTGEIYVCLSKPSVNILDGYDSIDTLEDGSLLCKVFYTTVPGSTQKISTLAAALEEMGYEKLLEKSYSCSGSYTNQSSQIIKCHLTSGHGIQTIIEAFANSCNPFFAQLVEDEDLPLSSIIETYEAMGYAINGEEETLLEIDGIVAHTATTTLTDSLDFDTQWGCMGQGETMVSPLQLMLWQSAIANETGCVTNAYLIDHTTTVRGVITNEAETSYGDTIFTDSTATAIKEIMLANGASNYSTLLSGYTVGVKSGTAQVDNGDKENSLLVGFVDDAEFPIAFCVVIEDRVSGDVTTSTIVSTLLTMLRQELLDS